MKPMFKTKPQFTSVDPDRILFNVGALLDIPTGKYVKGSKGENILNGGLGLLTGIAGRGNTFKSTIMHYMMLSAASKIAESGYLPYLNTYDTEMNIELERLRHFSERFEAFKDKDIITEEAWLVTDKTKHYGDEWFEILKEFLIKDKVKNKSTYMIKTPMVDKLGKPIEMMFPTFGEVDSLSEFQTSNIQDIQDKNQLGDSGGNTIHMRSGLDKTRLLMELPVLCTQSAHYTLISAHVGEAMNIQAGPMSLPPPKKLQHMKSGDKIKGVTDKFYFLTTQFYQTVSTTILTNQGTKGPEYPKTRDREDKGSTDLNLVTLKQLRSKTGPSGYNLEIIVSQTEGVLPSLTEFHYIKENGRYGLEGSLVSYNLVLYPEVKIGRTTVRQTLDIDPKLRRAVKITSDLLQLKTFCPDLPLTIPPIEELYKKLEAEYGWDILLNTRDYWTFNQYEHEVPFLSTYDILEMFHDKYRPYFIKKKEK